MFRKTEAVYKCGRINQIVTVGIIIELREQKLLQNKLLHYWKLIMHGLCFYEYILVR